MPHARAFPLCSLLAVASTDAQHHAVELRVFERNGAAVREARVTLLRVDGAGMPLWAQPERTRAPWQLTSRDLRDGVAVLGELPEGRFALQVEATPHAAAVTQPFTIPADPMPLREVPLERGATLHGMLVDEAGAPVGGAHLRSAKPEDAALWSTIRAPWRPVDTLAALGTARTDASGRFTLECLAGGERDLIVERRDFVVTRVRTTVRSGQRNLMAPVALQRGATVRGTVTRDGRPVAGADIVLMPGRTPARAAADGSWVEVRERHFTTTDASGAFCVPVRLGAGAWDPYASLPPDVHGRHGRLADDASDRRLVIPDGATATTLTLVLTTSR